MNYSHNSMVTEVANTRANSRTDAPGVLVFPPLLYLAVLITGLVLQYFRPMHLGLATWARIAGVLVAVPGGAVAAWGRSRMVRAGTNVLPTRPALAIVTDGPFRFTRNPLYLGNLFVYAGLTLIFNSLWLLLFAAPMVLVLRWGIIAREERYLEAKFGEVYVAYKNRVRRWL